jgi:isoleucyl-tRNA synthetase
LAVLTEANGLPWPADMYLEGGDQYRGWFHSSLLVGVGLRGRAPYKECATNGWTLDDEGRPMSKSAGNGLLPEEIIKRYGADVLRLWVASVEYTEDVRLSQVILDRMTDAYRKFRNTFKYTLGNLHDFDPATDALPAGELLEIDRWMLHRTADLVERCLAHYKDYAFHRAYQALYGFATELSSFYFDVLKDRLYTTAPRSKARRSAQTAMYRMHCAFVRLAAPILAFTTEEVWADTRKPAGAPDSIHIAKFPQPSDPTAGLADNVEALNATWNALLVVRETVLLVLEKARNSKVIGSSLEARVVVGASGDQLALLRRYAAELPALFIVSEVEVKETPEGFTGLDVNVDRATGVKCGRCWKYTHDVGSDPELPTVCAPCAAAVREMFDGQ